MGLLEQNVIEGIASRSLGSMAVRSAEHGGDRAPIRSQKPPPQLQGRISNACQSHANLYTLSMDKGRKKVMTAGKAQFLIFFLILAFWPKSHPVVVMGEGS